MLHVVEMFDQMLHEGCSCSLAICLSPNIVPISTSCCLGDSFTSALPDLRARGLEYLDPFLPALSTPLTTKA